MPAHIYTRVGRYTDAVVANRKAIAADDTYLAACRPLPGVYPLGYVPHNHHFLWWASSMQGDSASALAAAEETAKRAWIPELIRKPELIALQDFWVTPLKAKVQFGHWDEILATPAPEADLAYPTAMWNFAQGMAKAAKGQVNEVPAHLQVLAQAAADSSFDKLMVGPQHPLSSTLKIAERVLAGTLAQSRKDRKGAIEAFRQAVALEDAVAYFEPPLWHQPARQKLGAALLAAGKSKEAEAVFLEDLKRNPENGWSLFGLQQSLLSQKRTRDAAAVAARLEKAWEHADTELKLSAL
jgi:tetratricopeptide (TPR) repeat protein